MVFAVAAWRTSHIPLKYLPVICGRGEAGHACDFGDAFSLPQKRQAVLYSKEQDILEYSHFHIFLKKTAAFALTDIYMVCNLIQRNLLRIMNMNIGQDVLKPCQVLLGLLFAGRKGIVILVKLLPDDGENEMHLQFIIRQRRLRNPMNIFDLVYNILVPFYLF